MAEPADLSPTIIEALYLQALDLADQARRAFDVPPPTGTPVDEDLARIAMSCEALRTTTRMMHALAWLLNQRAYLAGDLSEFQLRRHGRLPQSHAAGDASQLALLTPKAIELIDRTRRFYARLERIDNGWRDRFTMHPAAIHRLRDRLGRAVLAL